MDCNGLFNIGQKNLEALKNSLGDHDLEIYHEAVGGTKGRAISLEIGSGTSIIKTMGEGEEKV